MKTNKTWGGRFKKELDPQAAIFNASISFDYVLYPYDIAGSIAHTKMLEKQLLISRNDAKKIINGLKEYEVTFDEGPISETEEIGNYGPYIQSEREDIYKAFAKQLIVDGKAYPCFCTEEELESIIKRTSRVLNMPINDGAAKELAKRSRKTPRIANRLFKRVRDFALVNGDAIIDEKLTKESLKKLKVDDTGLDQIDIEYLVSLIKKFNGGPVGVETIATSIGEEVTTIEDVVEPFLLQEGYVKRTPRGRIATDKAYDHLKIDHYQKTLI